MVAYSFKQQFVAPILSGAKCQTIRADRKRHACAGEEMQLYTGMRTKQCRLIARATCRSLAPITIDTAYHWILIDGQYLRLIADLDIFSQKDGFSNWQQMRKFWETNHPDIPRFSGVLIRWMPLRTLA